MTPQVEVHAIRKVDGDGERVVGVGVEIDSVGMNESRQLWHIELAVG